MLAATGPTSVIVGILFQFVIGAFLHWRTVAMVSSIMPCFTILALCFVPESPYWLLNKGRIEDARKSLAWLRGWVSVDNVEVEFIEIHDGLLKKKKESDALAIKSIMHRMLPYTRRSFIAPFALLAFAILIGHFSGETALQTYAVQIFRTLRAPMDEYYATILLGATQFIGALICVCSVRYTGKRLLTFISLIGCGLCFLVTATYANIYLDFTTGLQRSTNTVATNFSMPSHIADNYLNKNDKEIITTVRDLTDNNPEFHWIPLTFLLLSALFAHAGFRLIPWIMIGEVFPTVVRSGASGFASGIGYFFGFLTNKIFLGMISSLTLPGTFWFNSAVSLIGCAVLYFILPETEGKTLFEIEPFFAGKSLLIESNENKVEKKKDDLELVSVLKPV